MFHTCVFGVILLCWKRRRKRRAQEMEQISFVTSGFELFVMVKIRHDYFDLFHFIASIFYMGTWVSYDNKQINNFVCGGNSEVLKVWDYFGFTKCREGYILFGYSTGIFHGNYYRSFHYYNFHKIWVNVFKHDSTVQFLRGFLCKEKNRLKVANMNGIV